MKKLQVTRDESEDAQAWATRQLYSVTPAEQASEANLRIGSLAVFFQAERLLRFPVELPFGKDKPIDMIISFCPFLNGLA